MSYGDLAIYIKKYLNGKERMNYGKLKYFTMQKYNLQKKSSLKEPKKSFQRYHNSITNSQVSTQAQNIIIFQKKILV